MIQTLTEHCRGNTEHDFQSSHQYFHFYVISETDITITVTEYTKIYKAVTIGTKMQKSSSWITYSIPHEKFIISKISNFKQRFELLFTEIFFKKADLFLEINHIIFQCSSQMNIDIFIDGG